MKLKIKKIAKSILSGALLLMIFLPLVSSAAGTGFSASNPITSKNFTDIVRGLLTYLLVFIGIAAVLGFVVAGIMYITAAGDEDRVKSAKNMMLYSIMGIVVALIGYAVVNLVFGLIVGNDANTL